MSNKTINGDTLTTMEENINLTDTYIFLLELVLNYMGGSNDNYNNNADTALCLLCENLMLCNDTYRNIFNSFYTRPLN